MRDYPMSRVRYKDVQGLCAVDVVRVGIGKVKLLGSYPSESFL